MQIEQKPLNPFHDRSNGIGKDHGFSLVRACHIFLTQSPDHTQWLRLSIHYAPHEIRPSAAYPCQQPASVESESNHLMLNLISLISPCLQLVHRELEVHASCLFWVLQELGYHKGGRVQCSGKNLFVEKNIMMCCKSCRSSYWGFLQHITESHSGKLEIHFAEASWI